MCLLTFVPPDVQPTEKHLRKGAENNPDGHGFAIVHNDRIIVRKNMEPDTLIETFMRLRSKHPDGPALFHSRIGTGGVVDKRNCHPFIVGNDPRTVVGHNGILPFSVQPAKGDHRSDTAIFAQTLLPMRNFDGHRSMRKLSGWLRGDKLVILTTNPRWKYRAYVVNQNNGTWDKGCWYSNTSFNESYYSARWGGWDMARAAVCMTAGCRNWTYLRHCGDCRGEWPEAGPCDICGNITSTRVCFHCLMNMDSGKYEEWLDMHGTSVTEPGTVTPLEAGLSTRSPDECLVCHAYGTVSTVTNTCVACLICQDCGEEAPGSCLCYVPAQLDRDMPMALEGSGRDDGHTIG